MNSPLSLAPAVPPDEAAWQECLRAIQDRIIVEPQEFGRGQLYQGHEAWQILGQRPTLERLRHYRVEDWLPLQARVLDIGCNIGLFGLTLSPHISEYQGIDSNPVLIDIARLLARTRRIDNCFFQQTNFLDFVASHPEASFDVVLSFAVHVWIGLSPQDYAALLYRLLTSGGKLVLESNHLAKNDKDFFANVQHFTAVGLEIEARGQLKDDGIIERGFYVLRKPSENA